MARKRTRIETIGPHTLILGDCREVMAGLVPDHFHAGVTDPPYELGFMGKGWDSTGVAADPKTWEAVRRILRPGGHLAAFAGSRTYHRIAGAIDHAGFEIRDMLLWMYGSGVPKGLDIAKAIEAGSGQPERLRRKALGADYKPSGRGRRNYDHGCGSSMRGIPSHPAGSPQGESDATSKKWDGWGTALKPAHEPIALARKPLSEGAVARNILRHETGGLNIDASRVVSGPDHAAKCASVVGIDSNRNGQCFGEWGGVRQDSWSAAGRWPANVLHDGSLEVIEAFAPMHRPAARFFYSPKATREEREEGLRDGGVGALRDGKRATSKVGNFHPTVKPVDLMRWLATLVTAPGGGVIDPFMGSGSTGIACVRAGFRFTGIEQSADYFDIARRRIEHAVAESERMPDIERAIEKAVHEYRVQAQFDLQMG